MEIEVHDAAIVASDESFAIEVGFTLTTDEAGGVGEVLRAVIPVERSWSQEMGHAQVWRVACVRLAEELKKMAAIVERTADRLESN